MANTTIPSELIQASVALGGSPTTTTQSASDNTTKIATTAYVTAAVNALIDSAPGTMNTLNEIAAALNDDAAFNTTVTNAIATKLPLGGGTMTGNIAHASDFTIDAGGNIILDADGGDIKFLDGGTETLRYSSSGDGPQFFSPVADKDIIFKGKDGSSTITALTLDMSDAGKATFNSGATFGDYVVASDGTRTNYFGQDGNGGLIGMSTNHYLRFITNNTERMRIDSGGKVGINTASPSCVNGGIHAVHANNEGNPTYTGAEVGIFQRNFNNAQGAAISIVGGSNSESTVNFADKDDANVGQINYQHSSNAMLFRVNDAERMRIDSSGRVGIGGTSSGVGTAGLTVNNGDIRTTAPAFANKENSFSMSQESGGGTLCARGADNGTRGTIQLSVNAANGGNGIIALKVENNAHITLNDVTRLQQGAAASKGTSGGVGGFELNIDSNAPRMNWYNDAGATAAVQYFYYEGTERGSIQVLAGSTAYVTSSDYRLKENVDYTWDATTRLKQLKPARFNFKNDAGNTVDGFLAHEVSSIVPDSIFGTKDEVDSDGKPKYQGIDQSKLVPLLTKAIQEQQTLIESLTARIETLEG